MSKFKKMHLAAIAAGSSMLASFHAWAVDSEIATTANAALATAKTDATSVGGNVIGVVCGLVVVSIIILLVRKA
jgi:hypothetical protein